jgi:hypothetical protein
MFYNFNFPKLKRLILRNKWLLICEFLAIFIGIILLAQKSWIWVIGLFLVSNTAIFIYKQLIK